jgi:hypothetical protein
VHVRARGAHQRPHRVGVGPAVLAVEGQRPVDDVRRLRRHARLDGGDLARGHRHGREEQLVDVVRLVDELPGQQGEHRRADGPEIAARVDRVPVPERLLRRHERRRPHRAARRRQPPGARAEGNVAHPRQAEVEHLDLPGPGEEEVLRLDVAVDDALLVGRGEHVEQLIGDREHLGRLEPLPGAPRGPGVDGLTLEQLHHQEDCAVLRGVVVEHGDRARVIDGIGRVALAEEALARLRVRAQLEVQHLHRPALAVAVSGGVHRGHPAHAEEGVEAPLLPKHEPHARLCALRDGVHGRGGHEQLEPPAAADVNNQGSPGSSERARDRGLEGASGGTSLGLHASPSAMDDEPRSLRC